MVTNAAALAAVTDGPDGLLAGIAPKKLYIDMSTVSPDVSRALAAKVREKGADMVDGPVSGSVITLQQGKLSGSCAFCAFHLGVSKSTRDSIAIRNPAS